jgi:REP element-mobilizing transposase RayT
MSRPLRIEFAHGLYHVTSRGDGREDIFREDADRELFLEVLSETVERFNWVIHAYCLMGNHYHLLIETPDGNLSKGMRQLNGVYTQRFNRRHKRVGHVFQGRYKAIIVQKDSYLLELARYIVLNPVRAQMVRSARDWPWSSYRATADMAAGPGWLATDPILSAFGQRRAEAVAAYREFVAAGRNQRSPWAMLKNQIYLGSDAFVAKMQRKVEVAQDLSEVPAAQRRRMAKPLEHYARKYADRDEAIEQAYASGGYGMKAIGDHFGLHYSRVSRILAGRRKAKG